MSKKMILGMEFGNGYGTTHAAWREAATDPEAYTDFDALIRYAKAAERGKIHFLFIPDGPFHEVDIENRPPAFSLDAVLTTGALARETKHIGFIGTASTTHNAPYNLARQFKTLDVMSRGRVGWNAVTSAGSDVAANYGVRVTPSAERYSRAHEAIHIAQALWGSWGEDAWVHDQQSGRYTAPGKVAPINLGGQHVASRGPLYIPPSEQGQPVIFQSGASRNIFELAGKFATGVIGIAGTIEDARMQRNFLRSAAVEAGREADEAKFFAGFSPTIAATKREALERRARLMGDELSNYVPYLGSILGIRLGKQDLNRVLGSSDIQNQPTDARSRRVHELVHEGWSVQDIIAHGVLDGHPAVVGTAIEVADHLQEWFEAEAVDGFWLIIDVYQDGIDTFVDEVVPILQERGIFHEDYEGETLRENLGIPHQYGVDPRIVSE